MKSKSQNQMDQNGSAQPVCAQEALDLLNCVTQSPFDQDKCFHLLQSLRQCVLTQKVKKFSLAGVDQHESRGSSKNA